MLFSPQVALTAALRPRASFTLPTLLFSHLTRRVCLERSQHPVWFAVSGDHRVDVIGANIDSPQKPFANLTGFSNGFFNQLSLVVSQLNWRLGACALMGAQ